MATYFHSQNSEIQTADGLQNLVLMNPAYVQYTSAAAAAADTPQAAAAAANSLFFLNPAACPASAFPHALPLPPPQHPQAATTQQFVGLPLHASMCSQHHQDHPSSSGYSHSVHEHNHDVVPAMHGFLPRVQYGAWSSLEQSEPGRDTSHGAQQGLSLTLSSQQQQGFVRRGFRGDEREVPAVSGGSPSSVSGVTGGGGSGGSGGISVLLGSKYLKAAQELLDEVVIVGSGSIVKSETPSKGNGGSSKAGGGESSASAKEDGSSREFGDGKHGAELSTAERQEIQMKKAKLIGVLDEVEQKYRQYHHQMQIVISAFEHAAGIGSARTYTSLALQTISKQFRCLKDVISSQIRAASKSLGEDEPPEGKIEGSRLKFIDHHIRQQRALQQLSMIQHNAWRPQRGLPERSVSILRAWLFEHFLHPYPKDSDKHMLAKQTGLTRSQVSNWFINARVRLWKPMVEEMYTEAVKDQEQNGADGKVSKGEPNDDSSASRSTGLPEKSVSVDNHGKNSFNSKETNLINQDAVALAANSMSTAGTNLRNHQLSGFSVVGSSELDGITQGASPKKPRNTSATADMLLSPINVSCINVEPNKRGEPITIKFGDDGHVHGRDSYSVLSAGPANFIGGFGQYPIAEIGRFATEQQFASAFQGNGVSLTLGLPRSENLPMSAGTGAAHPGFIPGQGIHLGRRVEVGEGNEFGALNNPMLPHSSTAYEGMNMQSRKRFAAQLLPDFVT